MKTIVFIILILATVIFLFLFKNKGSNVQLKEESDPEILQAKEQAQSQIGDFIEKLRENKNPGIAFNIKTNFTIDENNTEHMWVLVSSYENGVFTGTLNNEPEFVKNIKYGDTVKINESNVEDWIISDGQEMIGGFSTGLFKK